jgi:hypothetical protein
MSSRILKSAAGGVCALVGALILSLGVVACASDSAQTQSTSTISRATPKSTKPPPPAAPSTGSVRGHVAQANGAPAQSAWVEFKVPDCAGCQQIWTTTDADGSYSIRLPNGFYLALCGLDDDPGRACSPVGGNGGPYPVEVPPYDHVINFRVGR